MRRILLIAVGCVLALTGLAAPATATGSTTDHLRAFRGHLEGAARFVPADPNAGCTTLPVQTVSEATGTATHMGRVSMTAIHCSGNTIAGTMVLTSKHGSVSVGYAGDCTPVPPFPPVVTCDLELTVLGGDGRFEGAQGSGRMIASVHPPQDVPDPIAVPWPATWTWTGTISY